MSLSLGLAFSIQLLLLILQASLDPEYAILVRWNDYGEAIIETVLLLASVVLMAASLLSAVVDAGRQSTNWSATHSTYSSNAKREAEAAGGADRVTPLARASDGPRDARG